MFLLWKRGRRLRYDLHIVGFHHTEEKGIFQRSNLKLHNMVSMAEFLVCQGIVDFSEAVEVCHECGRLPGFSAIGCRICTTGADPAGIFINEADALEPRFIVINEFLLPADALIGGFEDEYGI